jgi:AraC-like DNA-binding protein
MIAQNIKSNIPNSDIYIDQRITPHIRGKIAGVHYHEEIELLFVLTGTLICHVNDKSYTAVAGDIVFINSSVPHGTSTPCDDLIYGLLQFRDDRIRDKENAKILKYSIKYQGLAEEPVKIFRSPEMMEEYKRIYEEAKGQRQAYDTMIKGSVLKITAALYRLSILCHSDDFYDTAKGKKMLPALSYINKNYNETITLEEVSKLLGFNESYFCRLFKLATGTTFTEYLNFVRICKAEKLLSEGGESILDIATAVGFSSVSYFNRIFKKYKSCSPGFYRTLKYCKNI